MESQTTPVCRPSLMQINILSFDLAVILSLYSPWKDLKFQLSMNNQSFHDFQFSLISFLSNKSSLGLVKWESDSQNTRTLHKVEVSNSAYRRATWSNVVGLGCSLKRYLPTHCFTFLFVQLSYNYSLWIINISFQSFLIVFCFLFIAITFLIWRFSKSDTNYTLSSFYLISKEIQFSLLIFFGKTKG